eukprot:3884394-Pyramimonas_sp.AAC.1
MQFSPACHQTLCYLGKFAGLRCGQRFFGAAREGVVEERSWEFCCPLSHALPRPAPFFPSGCWRPSSGLGLGSRGGFLESKAYEGPAS